MIPHAPPMRFDVDGDLVTLPAAHPMQVDGRYPTLGLLELVAQLAGRRAPAEPGHRGMLVEVEGVEVFVESVAPGACLRAEVTLVRSFGPLHRFTVALEGVLTASLTLRIAP